MELSKVITHLGRRFREAGTDVAFFGNQLGYTIAESASLAEAWGASTNTVSRSELRRTLGFARQQGLDPQVAVSVLGSMRSRMTRAVTDAELARLVHRADRADMGQGRFGEFAQGFTGIMDAAFRATGKVDFDEAMSYQAVPGLIWGSPSDPRAKGDTGLDLAGRVSSLVSGSTNPAMKVFMMRAMGYGTKGGPGYIDMRKRLDAGLHDSRNLLDLFKSFRSRGMGRGAQFRALESIAGGSLKAFELEALIDNLGTSEGMSRYWEAQGTGAADQAGFTASLTEQERSAYASGGFTALGRLPGRISMGEGAAQQMEGMQMAVGEPIAKGLIDLRETLKSLAGGLNNLVGVDLGKLLTDLTGALRDATNAWEQKTRIVKRAGGVIEALTPEFDPDMPGPGETSYGMGGLR